MRAAAIALLSGMVGLGLGFLLFRSGTGQRTSDRASPRTPHRDPGPGVSTGRSSGRRPPVGATQLARAALRAELVRVRQQNSQLQGRNRTLQSKLDELQGELRFVRGKPAPWPSDVPSRLKRDALVRSWNKALREAGLQGEITDVDCKEYPCVLAGSVAGEASKKIFGTLLRTRALDSYGHDEAETSITTRKLHDAKGRLRTRSYFSIAMFLRGPVGTTPDVKRTIYRIRQLLDAATGM